MRAHSRRYESREKIKISVFELTDSCMEPTIEGCCIVGVFFASSAALTRPCFRDLPSSAFRRVALTRRLSIQHLPEENTKRCSQLQRLLDDEHVTPPHSLAPTSYLLSAVIDSLDDFFSAFESGQCFYTKHSLCRSFICAEIRRRIGSEMTSTAGKT